jgi:ketosteroid isomerase-like protein
MKKITWALLLVVAGVLSVFAQKKTNGTVYIEHPAINVVNDFLKALEAGDKAKMASYLTDDFKGYDGTSNHSDGDPKTKEAFLADELLYSQHLDYFSIRPVPDSYPDAIEYEKDNKSKEVWVQTWNLINGVEKGTGVKIDAAAHFLFRLTKDNKIKSVIDYTNNTVIKEIQASSGKRTNGTIYNHHDNINTVRKATYDFEKGNVDKSLSYYSDKAVFSDINDAPGTTHTKVETKKDWQEFLNGFEIKSIDMIGYPDYLEYEMDNGREVLSWWKFNLVRKSDKKAISLYFHFSDSFDADGKITAEFAYYSKSLLDAK